MLDLVKKVMYEKKEFPYSQVYFMLEINENGNVLGYKDNLQTIKKENVDNKIVEEYLDKLIRIIDGWKEKYENQNIIDRTEWNLQINFKDGTKKLYSGKNDFPNNFEYLDKINHEIMSKL